MDNLKQLEAIASELIRAFDVSEPPVPVEQILQNPKPTMWEEVNVNQLTGSFLSVRDRFSPRMSMTRLLARHVIMSDWGRERNLPELINHDETLIRDFARMLIMPSSLLAAMTSRNPVTVSVNFEVPEDDAEARLKQWSS